MDNNNHQREDALAMAIKVYAANPSFDIPQLAEEFYKFLTKDTTPAPLYTALKEELNLISQSVMSLSNRLKTFEQENTHQLFEKVNYVTTWDDKTIPIEDLEGNKSE